MERLMPNAKFDEVWNRILKNEGETFYTKKGLEFKYEIDGDIFLPSRTNYQISKNDFMKAYQLVPIDGPGVINDIVRGPSYIWAVLHDKKISIGAW